MHLLNRLGPILVGIALETDSGNSYYKPLFHVHNLCREFPAVSLTLVENLEREYVKLSWHERKHKELAIVMREKARIPFSGDVTIESVMKGYEDYFEIPCLAEKIEYEDYALIAGWSGDISKINRALDVVKSSLKSWPEERYFKKFGGFDNWFATLEKRVMDKDMLHSIVETQIAQLKVEKLPVRNLII